MMSRIFCGILVMVAGLLLAEPVQAQISKPTITPQRTTAPRIPRIPKTDDLPVAPPNLPITGHIIAGPSEQVLELLPPPETFHANVSCIDVTVTRLAFMFHCIEYTLLPDEYFSVSHSTWIIRRDGTQPAWALTAEDADWVRTIATKDRYGRLNRGNQFTGDYYERMFVTVEGYHPPKKYCSINMMKPSSSANQGCYELMAVHHKAY